MGERRSLISFLLLRSPLFFDTIDFRSIMPRHRQTEAEKVAIKLAKLVNDVSLDLDDVGRYLAEVAPTVSYNRLILIAEAAIAKKENDEFRTNNYPLFD
jgi:hypothetical protein